jgi:hypothetical protein
MFCCVSSLTIDVLTEQLCLGAANNSAPAMNDRRSPANGLMALFPWMISLQPDRKAVPCGGRQARLKASDALFVSVAPKQT